jgi:hypothetical protein
MAADQGADLAIHQAGDRQCPRRRDVTARHGAASKGYPTQIYHGFVILYSPGSRSPVPSEKLGYRTELGTRENAENAPAGLVRKLYQIRETALAVWL